jgi:rhomboid protease GluP
LKTYISKLKHILPTLLIIALSLIFGLLLFRWLFSIQFEIINVKEKVWTLWLPLVLPWIPFIIWLRPRLRVLTFKKEADTRRFFFMILSAGVIIPCHLVSQSYLTTASGKLQTIANIKEIDKIEKARYYKIADFNVANYYGGAFTDFSVSGKHNNRLNFDVYFAFPIVVRDSINKGAAPKHWYGIKYQKQISNKISDEEKDKEYQSFYKECIEKINSYNYYSLDHFERIPTSDDKENYLKAIESRVESKTNGSFAVFEPIAEKFEDRNGDKFAWIFGSFGIGLGVLLLSLIWPGYSENESRRFLAGKKPKQDDLVDMLNYLIPKGGHFSTSIILDLNILVFLAMVFSGMHILSPDALELLAWGGNKRAETTGGEWWRLLTSFFLHCGIMHLILNISGLVFAAIFIEPILGRKRYFILYILSGLCASLASILWYPDTISVGASGAIFGLYGALLGLLLTNAFPKGGKMPILIMMGFYVVVNLLWGLTGGIDNAAHIGGLLSGAIIGIILYQTGIKKKHTSNKDPEKVIEKQETKMLE